jgi:hypothetical protein
VNPVVLRRSSAVLLGAAPVLVAILHVVSPDLEPRSSRLSQYANGTHGHLMTLAFIALGIGMLMLAAALHSQRERRRVPWSVQVGVAVAGAGMVISGFVATDPGSANSMREAIHSLASGLASVTLVGTALVWLVGGRWRTPVDYWQPSRPGAACAVVAAALAVVSPWLHRSSWTGLSQRSLWVALLCWLFAVVWSLRSAATTHVSDDVSGVSATAETIDA